MQQLIQQPEQRERTETREETETDFDVDVLGDQVYVTRTDTTLTAEATLDKSGERTLSLDESTDTEQFSFSMTPDVDIQVDLDAAWDSIADALDTTGTTTPWHLLATAMYTPEVTAVAHDILPDIEIETRSVHPTPITYTHNTAVAQPRLDQHVDYNRGDLQMTYEVDYSIDEYFLSGPFADEQEQTEFEDDLLDEIEFEVPDIEPVLDDTENSSLVHVEHYDPAENEDGLRTELTYKVIKEMGDTVKDTLEYLIRNDEIDAEIQTEEFYVTEEWAEKDDMETGWHTGYSFDIDDMDYDHTEFLVNGELAMDGIDQADVDAGDYITVQDAEKYGCAE